MKVSIKPFIIAAAMLATVAFAADGTFSLKRVAKVGDTFKYKLTAKAELMGTPIDVVGKSSEKVIKVSEGGEWVIESAQSEMVVKVGDQEMKQPDESPTTTSYDAKGLITEIKAEKVEASVYRLGNMSVLLVPEKPVKVGDKWSHDFKADAKTGAVAGKGEYEVLGTEKIGTWDCVKIKLTYKETEGSEPASASGTIWIDQTDGFTVKSDMDLKQAPIAGAPMPLDIKMVQERV